MASREGIADKREAKQQQQQRQSWEYFHILLNCVYIDTQASD